MELYRYKKVLLLLLLIFSPNEAHLRVSYPPARSPLDFLDNLRTPAPCGSNRLENSPVTQLKTGSELKISFWKARLHCGGTWLELLDGSGGIIANLTSLLQGDYTDVEEIVQLPDDECIGCSIRARTYATEWGDDFYFTSCADVDIAHGGPDCPGSCNDGGICSYDDTDVPFCYCDASHTGTYCETILECNTDEDCGTNQVCVLGLCECVTGYTGDGCEAPTALTDELNSQNYKLLQEDGFSLYWRINTDTDEIEMAMQVETNSWVAVGIRPLNETAEALGISEECAVYLDSSPLIPTTQVYGSGSFYPMGSGSGLFPSDGSAIDAGSVFSGASGLHHASSLSYLSPSFGASGSNVGVGSALESGSAVTLGQGSGSSMSFAPGFGTSGPSGFGSSTTMMFATGFGSQFGSSSSVSFLSGFGSAETTTTGLSTGFPVTDGSEQAFSADGSGLAATDGYDESAPPSSAYDATDDGNGLSATGSAAEETKTTTMESVATSPPATTATTTTGGIRRLRGINANAAREGPSAGRDQTRARRLLQFEQTHSVSDCWPDGSYVAEGEANSETVPVNPDCDRYLDSTHLMNTMDMIIGWASDSGYHVGDYWSVSRSTPVADSLFYDKPGVSNLSNTSGSQVDGVTTIRWTRPLVTEDVRDWDIIEGLYEIVWAHGQGQGDYDPPLPSPYSNDAYYADDILMYHGANKGTFGSVRFLENENEESTNVYSEYDYTVEIGS
eukprot:Rmarinus@m.22485